MPRLLCRCVCDEEFFNLLDHILPSHAKVDGGPRLPRSRSRTSALLLPGHRGNRGLTPPPHLEFGSWQHRVFVHRVHLSYFVKLGDQSVTVRAETHTKSRCFKIRVLPNICKYSPCCTGRARVCVCVCVCVCNIKLG